MPHALATTVKHGIGTRVTIAHAAQLASLRLIPPSGPKGDSDAHRQEIWDRTPADVPKQLRLRIGVMPRCAHRSRDLSHTSRDAPRYVSRRHVLLLPNATLRERHQHRVVASKREGEPPRFGLETGRFLHEKPTRTGSWDYPVRLP